MIYDRKGLKAEMRRASIVLNQVAAVAESYLYRLCDRPLVISDVPSPFRFTAVYQRAEKWLGLTRDEAEMLVAEVNRRFLRRDGKKVATIAYDQYAMAYLNFELPERLELVEIR